jgi:hypothetical protein
MRKVQHTETFEIAQPIQELFHLFSAEGEKKWVPGWTYKNIMSSTELHEDYIFITKSHDHATTDAIWIVKKYEPENYRVQFYKVEPGDKIGIIEVVCVQLTDTSTEVQVAYEYIGLSGKGDLFIKDFTASKYKEFIAEWKILLDTYFNQKTRVETSADR